MESLKKSLNEEKVKVQKISFRGFYVRNLVANIFGFVTIVILNLFTPLNFFELQKSFLFTEGGWKGFFLFYPVVVTLVFLLQFHVQRPISSISNRIYEGREIPDGLHEKARKRLLNLPFIIAMINVAIYIFLPALVTSAFFFFRDIPLRICLFLFFRAFMIGLIAAGLSFFLVEDYSRKTLIPWLFPNGRLATQPGTIKIPVLRRIRMLNMAGTLNPMIIMVVTLLFILWEIDERTISVHQLGKEIFLFTLILCVIFVFIALRLNVLVSRSILNPIREMLGIVEKVRGGDFTQRIRVLSNDEIGILGDTGNDMIRGLADRERIRDTFGRYVTPEIRDQILAGGIPLSGERKEATLLFTDLRDFTSYVEQNDPEEVIRSMRDYFTAMERSIRKHQGLVLQYVGDEIEAVFGVPLPYAGHTDRAVLAALELRRNLEELNKDRIKKGKVPFRHGIGIHAGDVLVGNTGSEERLSYALIGDTVNVASRIEGLTKEFRCDILVSEEAVKRLKGSFNLKRELPTEIKGFSRPVTVFQVIS